MYIDINIKPYERDGLGRILRVAKRMGFTAVAVEGLTERVEGDLMVVPRVTYRYSGKPLNHGEFGRDKLTVYEICDPMMVRSLNNLRGRCQALKIAGNVLVGLKGKHIKALRSCGIPIEISLKDIIINNSANYNALRGLLRLIPYVERGDIELVVSSSAGNEFELMHPLEITAILKELGLSELTSIRAVSSLPLRILKVLRSGV